MVSATYTIKREYGSYRVFKITSEKPRMLYGSIDGVGSHAKPADCVGRFPSEEAATAAIRHVKELYDAHADLIYKCQQALHDAKNSRDNAIEALLRGQR